MPISAASSLREVAFEPGGARVLGAYRILYGCRGAETLGQACAGAGLELDRVLARLEQARQAAASGPPQTDWQRVPVVGLLAHIVDEHHAFTRRAMEELEPLLTQVLQQRLAEHPALSELGHLVAALRADVEPHLAKEERGLFPYIAQLERAAGGARAFAPLFGSVANPVHLLDFEHQRVGELLTAIRANTCTYQAPPGADERLRALYARLDALDADLVLHVHLESNVLFPRALALEQRGPN